MNTTTINTAHEINNNRNLLEKLRNQLKVLGYMSQASNLLLCGIKAEREQLVQEAMDLVASGKPASTTKASKVSTPKPIVKTTPKPTPKKESKVLLVGIMLVRDLPKGGPLGVVRKELESQGILEVQMDFRSSANLKADKAFRADTKGVTAVTPTGSPKPTEVLPQPKQEVKKSEAKVPAPTPEGFQAEILKKELKEAIGKSIANSKKAPVAAAAPKKEWKHMGVTVPKGTVYFTITGGKATVYCNIEDQKLIKSKKLKAILN